MDKIFVQIPSLRDPECQWTIRDLFRKAANPARISVGVCWQYDPTADQACFTTETRADQVRTLFFHYTESQGQAWARHQAQRLRSGEKYTLSIDSHMRFEPGWDTRLITQLQECPSNKAVISHFPSGYNPPDDLQRDEMPSVTRANPYIASGAIRMHRVPLSRRPPHPLRGAFVAPGFLFGESAIFEDMPWDPYMYFDQEELSLAVRLFTHGVDVYSPTETIAYHYYNSFGRDNTPEVFHWNNYENWRTLDAIAAQRLNHLIGYAYSTDPIVTREITKYGLGKTRSLDEFEDFTGIYLKNQKMRDRPLRCAFIENLSAYLDGPIYVPALDDNRFDPEKREFYPENVFTTINFTTNFPTSERVIVNDTPKGVLAIHNYLSLDHCKRIIEYADQQTATELGTTEMTKDGFTNIYSSVRTTNHVDIGGLSTEILTIFNDIVGNRMAPFFDVNFEWYERPQILRYPVGGKYLPHTDAEEWSGETNTWERVHDRDFSSILYLNDDFEGGHLSMPNHEISFEPRPGMLLCFPSNHHYLHGVNPTTSGTRYAIVSWAAVFGTRRANAQAPYASVFLQQRRAQAA